MTCRRDGLGTEVLQRAQRQSPGRGSMPGDEVPRSWNIIVEWTCNIQRSFIENFTAHIWHLYGNSYCTFWNSYYTVCAPKHAIL